MTAKLVTLAIITAAPTPAAACPYRAVDGDTIAIIATGETIRLIGFDTPETTYARCEAERRLGEMAARRLEAIICRPGARVSIERDEARRDPYKRTLAVVRVDSRDVAEIMVAEGWARPYNGSIKKGWCSRDSRDDLIPGPPPKR